MGGTVVAWQWGQDCRPVLGLAAHTIRRVTATQGPSTGFLALSGTALHPPDDVASDVGERKRLIRGGWFVSVRVDRGVPFHIALSPLAVTRWTNVFGLVDLVSVAGSHTIGIVGTLDLIVPSLLCDLHRAPTLAHSRWLGCYVICRGVHAQTAPATATHPDPHSSRAGGGCDLARVCMGGFAHPFALCHWLQRVGPAGTTPRSLTHI